MTTQIPILEIAKRFTVRAMFIGLVSALTFGVSVDAFGQAALDGIGGPSGKTEIRIFRDVDGDEFFRGEFVEMNGLTVTLRDKLGKEVEFKMGDFYEEDKQWIHDTISARRKFEKMKKDAEHILKMADLSKPTQIVKTLNKLKKTGVAASHMTNRLNKFMKHDDVRVRKAALITFGFICQKTERNMKHVIDSLGEDSGVYKLVEKSPRDFILALASFDELGFEYVKDVAFDCKLRVEEVGGSTEPFKLKLGKSAKSNIRTEACRVLGQFDSADDRELSVQYLMDVLDVSREPINGVKEDATIKAIIRSFASLGIYSPDVIKTIRELEKEYPEEVADAMKKLKAKKLADDNRAEKAKHHAEAQEKSDSDK